MRCVLFRRPGELSESRSFASLSRERFAFSIAPKIDTDLLRSTSQGLWQVTPNSNQSATASQPGERILRLPEPSPIAHRATQPP